MAKRTQTPLKLKRIYLLLSSHFGPQHWWPGESPFEVVVGAILTQSAAWTNVEKAIANLKRRGLLTPKSLLHVSQEELAQLVYSSGYYNAKARKLKAFVQHLYDRRSGNLDKLFDQDVSSLRQELLSIHGVGEETADSIILYAAGKPIFVIDAYTRRVADRMGLGKPGWKYSDYQALFMEALDEDARLFNEYHALFVQLGKGVCRKSDPACTECCLAEECKFARRKNGHAG